jgi:thioesterase domain-containing protein
VALRALNPSALTWDCLKPALFCVHGLSGIVTDLLRLADYLDAKMAVFGFQVTRQAMAGKTFGTAVPDMAADYANQIEVAQPSGPVFLLGYSAGGIVAHEMASILLERGREIGFVALLDTIPHPDYPRIRPFRPSYIAAVALNLPRWLMYKHVTRRKGGAARFNRSDAEINRHLNIDTYTDTHAAFVRRFFAAITRHTPRVWLPCRLIVYEALVKSLIRPVSAAKVWASYGGQPIKVGIAAHHADLLKEPFVGYIAADLGWNRLNDRSEV